MNGVQCSRLYGGVGGRYLAAVFDGSRLHETNLFPRGHTKGVNSALYSPAGDKIVSASDDGTVKEWDAATGECLRTLKWHTDWVRSAAYSPGGDKIISASDDGTVKEYDLATGIRFKTHRIEDKHDLSEYHSKNTLNKELETFGREISLPISPPNPKHRTLINLPGLWIQGCSFKNLEKNSQWSKKALELMKQYGARF